MGIKNVDEINLLKNKKENKFNREQIRKKYVKKNFTL